jgi:hypothetical protein
MTIIKNTLTITALCIAIFFTALLFIEVRPQIAKGSVPIGNEYHATTTSTGRFQNDILLSSGSGTLGSVVITGAGAGTIDLYDATTSNVSNRTGQPATSTILIASFPASAAAATYTFDEAYYNGLYVHIVGTMPTSTITFR